MDVFVDFIVLGVIEYDGIRRYVVRYRHQGIPVIDFDKNSYLSGRKPIICDYINRHTATRKIPWLVRCIKTKFFKSGYIEQYEIA